MNNKNNMSSKGFTLWLTGLPGSGKTTLANLVQQALLKQGVSKVEKLDGDAIRNHLYPELGFKKEDRVSQAKRVAFICKLLTKNEVPNIAALISPYRNVRDEIRKDIEVFVEVYLNCSLEECERRDPKGLYDKARKGEINNFTGIDDPYEPPLNPEIVCNTKVETPEESCIKIIGKLKSLGLIGDASDSR